MFYFFFDFWKVIVLKYLLTHNARDIKTRSSFQNCGFFQLLIWTAFILAVAKNARNMRWSQDDDHNKVSLNLIKSTLYDSQTRRLLFQSQGLKLIFPRAGHTFIKPVPHIGKIFVYKHCFCYLNVQNVKTKELFVSAANSSLVGILITIGDITDIFAIGV